MTDRRHRGFAPAESALASVALTSLTAVTAAGFCRVFDGWSFLPGMLAVTLACHAVATALRLVRVPFAVALPVTLAVLVHVVAFLHYRETLAGPFVTRETFELARFDLTLVWEQFPTAVAPVPSSGGYVVGAALVLGLAAVAADAFAFRAYGRAEATVPTGVVMVFTAALGVDRNRVGLSAVWLAVALCVVVFLRIAHGRAEGGWLGRPQRTLTRAVPAAVVLAATVAGIAAAAGPRLPGAGERALVDTTNEGSDVTEVLSPLVDIRSRLVNQSDAEYFTVLSARPSYWRLTGLGVFDGTTWSLPSRALSRANGRFQAPDPGDVEILQTVTIRSMGGQLVPAAYKPIGSSSPQLQWVDDTATLVIEQPADLDPGMQFAIISAIGEPPVEQLRGASAAAPPDATYLALPDDFPDDIAQTAEEVTAAAATPYDKALALQNWFRSEFRYNIDVQRGHGVDSIESFLRLREGYCEQFAGAFAAMARAVGIPARVAVGFTPGDLQADGQYHVRGRNAHAWPEVWFDGVGWVLFEPTPGRGAPGAEATTGVPAAQEPPFEGGTAQPAPSQGAPPNQVPSAVPTTLPVDIAGPAATAPPAGSPAAADDSTEGRSVPVWLVVAVVLAALAGVWFAATPRVLRALGARRSAHRPAERITRAWRQAVAASELLGVDTNVADTAIEHSQRVTLDDAAARAALDELARQATRAVYAPSEPDEAAARRCEELAHQLRTIAMAQLPWTARLRARLDLRQMARLEGLTPALAG